MGCVLWIAIVIKNLIDMFGYIDDNFSYEVEGELEWYEPYSCFYPTKQTRLLRLWDEIGLPHEKAKQEFGSTLRIIGFVVDPNTMTITMDAEDRDTLSDHVHSFIKNTPGGTRRTLREFQQIAGYINWSLNVYPLFKPALSNLYAKMSGKTESFAKIHVNQAIVTDLTWFLNRICLSSGVHLIEDPDWDQAAADVVLFADACLSGLGFFYLRDLRGYQCAIDYGAPKETILFFEALAVCSALLHALDSFSAAHKVMIYTDNTNTVNIFHTLRALPPYNPILRIAVDALSTHNCSLRVVHIAGEDNVIADHLSRLDNEQARAACPGLSISTFQPPRVPLGRSKK